MLRTLAVTAVALPGAFAATADAVVRVPVPEPGGVEVSVVTTARPPAGSQRPSRVLRVANGRRLPDGVTVYASPAPGCSRATRRRFTALVVVTHRRPRSGGAGRVVLGGRDVRACRSYPLRRRFGDRAIRRVRCDRLTARNGPLLLGSDATCIGALQRRLALRSPYQLPLNLDLLTPVVSGPPASRNVTGTAALTGEPRPGVFRYAISIANDTPAPYRGVPSVAQDRTPDSLTFAASGGEESPNVVSGPTDVAGFACRVEVAPGLPGSLTCRAPRGAAMPARIDIEVDFDAPLAVGANAGIQITLPRYGDVQTTYDIDVTR